MDNFLNITCDKKRKLCVDTTLEPHLFVVQYLQMFLWSSVTSRCYITYVEEKKSRFIAPHLNQT